MEQASPGGGSGAVFNITGAGRAFCGHGGQGNAGLEPWWREHCLVRVWGKSSPAFRDYVTRQGLLGTRGGGSAPVGLAGRSTARW
jgi:hypothetical protein